VVGDEVEDLLHRPDDDDLALDVHDVLTSALRGLRLPSVLMPRVPAVLRLQYSAQRPAYAVVSSAAREPEQPDGRVGP